LTFQAKILTEVTTFFDLPGRKTDGMTWKSDKDNSKKVEIRTFLYLFVHIVHRFNR
jgi:hypothetical protein